MEEDTQVHPSVVEWGKWVQGPFQRMTQIPHYTEDILEAGLLMEEELIAVGTTLEQVAGLAGTVGVQLEPGLMFQALGMYLRRKRKVPNVREGTFEEAEGKGQGMGQGEPKTGDKTDSGQEGQTILELQRMLKESSLEVARLQEQLVPAITEKSLEDLLGKPMPYLWMGRLGKALKEQGASGWQGPLAKEVWAVLNEEVRAKKGGQKSAVAAGFGGGYQQTPQTGICFTCGKTGHWSRDCTFRGGQGNGQVQATFRARSGQVFDTTRPPPTPCNSCGQWHWAIQGCGVAQTGAAGSGVEAPVSGFGGTHQTGL
jgi:hypothetical protein